MSDRDTDIIADGFYVNRIDDETGKPIAVDEWGRWVWEDVTGLGDATPRYHRVRRIDSPR